MDGITGFYEARTDRVLCVLCAGTPRPARTPIAEPDCGDLHCSRCRQPLRPVNRRDEPNAAAGLFAYVVQERRAGHRHRPATPRRRRAIADQGLESRWFSRSGGGEAGVGGIGVMGKDSLAQIAQIAPAETAIGRPTATARRLVDASLSANTRRAYAGALGQLDAWLAGLRLDDAALAAYLAELHDAGRAASSAAMAVAAVRFRARLAGQADPAGERTARVLAGYRRTAGDRGRGVESDQVAAARGRLDAVIAALLFMGGLRRSEVAALRWADVADAGDADGILVTVRRSKTNQVGETSDVRYLKNRPARAVRALRAAAAPAPEGRVTAHSGRVGLASDLTSRGASTTDVMLAGNWKTSRNGGPLLRRRDR